MVQLRFTALYQTTFQSAYTTVRFIIIGINYKSHWYNLTLSLNQDSNIAQPHKNYTLP
jgi:hypothetical protein